MINKGNEVELQVLRLPLNKLESHFYLDINLVDYLIPDPYEFLVPDIGITILNQRAAALVVSKHKHVYKV